MKKITRITILATLLSGGVYAAPFMAVGDGAELFVTGKVGIRADDNITQSANEESDLIFDIAPGVELTFGKNAQLKGALTLVHEFSNYSDNSNLNTNLFSGKFTSNYDDGKLKLGFNTSFDEFNQNTSTTATGGTVTGLTRRDVFSAGSDAEVEITQITKIGGGITFAHENYKRAGYTDSDVLTVPVNVYYRWTEKTDLSFGYRYRDTQLDSAGVDSQDHYFNVGARGNFSAKLSGKFSVGLNNRDLEVGSDRNEFGFDSSLTYELTAKSNLQFGLSKDYGNSPQGQQQKNLSFNAAVTTELSSEWKANAGVTYRAIDYYSRTDDFFEFQLGATYVISTNARITGGYKFTNYSSVLSGSEFKNNVFSIAANLRY
jgi:hypothetical protein